MSSRSWRFPATLLTAGALAFSTMPAFADNVLDNVSGSGPVALTLSGGSASTTIQYQIQATGSGGGGGGVVCDATPSNPVTFNVVVGSGTAAVSSGVSELTFTACDLQQPVVYTATTAGTRNVELTLKSGSGTFNFNATKAILTVSAGSNTGPTVSVAGVTDGASYEFGAVPASSCTVTDAEDSGESATPSLSTITGPLSAYGLGSQTATCSYTDGGGLTQSASATYSIVDTTKPVLNTPGDQVLEATSPAGAEASWLVSGSDNVSLAGPATCDVTSPHTFDLGENTVNCSATDVAGNTSTGSFTVTVSDTTAPGIIAPADQTIEATGPDGAAATFADPTVSDNYDTVLSPVCTPASGSTFALGDTEVTCSVTDSSGNTSEAAFTISVVDTTPPALSEHGDESAEATGPDGAAVSFDKPTATDLVDGSTEVTCDYESGDTFALGDTTVTCSSTDAAGNTGSDSFTVSVVDTTAPAIEVTTDITAEATGPGGASVAYTDPAASDLVDGVVPVVCLPASPVTVAVDAIQEITCSATDAAGNSASTSFTISVVDTTAPTLILPANITTSATSASGAVVTYAASASDLVDGPVAPTCSPTSGSTFAPGTTTVSCTATDLHGNTSAPATFTVTVSFGFNGFFAPVDNNGVLNTIKGGQSVPLKWSIANGSGGFISSLGVVSGVKQAIFTCTAGAPSDDIEAPTSGATSLRYDTTANQYIYNWQSPKGANVCYKVTVYLTDGTSKSALFKTK